MSSSSEVDEVVSPSRVIVYIDGFNLYYGLKSRGWKRLYWLDPYMLATNLLRSGQSLVGVKYFTARILPNPSDPLKHRRQAIWLEAIESLDRARVFYGHFLPKERRCNSCGATWMSHEEKMTDVNIAVELLRDSYDDVFDTALLISADSDLTAPVEAVLARCPTKRIVVVSPPHRQSKKLESVASATFRLGRKVLQDSQFMDQVAKPDGFVLRRPPSWK